jgi:DNA-binding MarR family transcriptional regulator
LPPTRLPALYLDIKMISSPVLNSSPVAPQFPAHSGPNLPIIAPVPAPPDRVDALLAQWHEQRSELDVSPLHVVARVARLSHHLDRAVDSTLNQFDMKWWELDVLGALRRAGAPFRLSPGELSERLMVTSGTMTTRIDRLEKRAFVVREPAERDRRSVVVSLTRDGRKAIDSVMKPHLANLQQALEPLSAARQAELVETLRFWLVALEGEAPEDLSSDG